MIFYVIHILLVIKIKNDFTRTLEAQIHYKIVDLLNKTFK